MELETMSGENSKSLDAQSVYKVMRSILPEKNDYAECSYEEELAELLHFGVKTESELENLLKKHLKQVLEIDSKPFSGQYDELFYRKEYGDQAVDEAIAGGFWYAFPALLRLALELEFGQQSPA